MLSTQLSTGVDEVRVPRRGPPGQLLGNGHSRQSGDTRGAGRVVLFDYGRLRSSRETALASKLTGFRAGDYSFPGDESGKNEHRRNVRGGCDQCEWWAASEGACRAG